MSEEVCPLTPADVHTYSVAGILAARMGCTWTLVQRQLEIFYRQWGALISGVKLQFIKLTDENIYEFFTYVPFGVIDGVG